MTSAQVGSHYMVSESLQTVLGRLGLISAWGLLLVLWSAGFLYAAPPTLPRWEVGLGVGTVDFPVYRGSAERRRLTLPLPYVIYRGERVRVDREGVRGLLGRLGASELIASFGAALPVDSEDNDRRAGMPDLAPLLEFGPALQIPVFEGQDADLTVDLVLPARAAVSVDFNAIRYAGLTFDPEIQIRATNLLDDWDLYFSGGPEFANRRYHERFYGVQPPFARPDRRAYSAGAGYGGAGLAMSLQRRFGRLWVAMFMSYDNLAGARFVDSPLVETQHYLAGGFGVAWVFWECEREADSCF